MENEIPIVDMTIQDNLNHPVHVFTGVGSRDAPDDILELIEKISRKLTAMYWTVRTGDAEGCDKAFRDGAHPKRRIVFTRRHRKKENWSEAKVIAKKYHPKYESLGRVSKEYITRNVYQIMGRDLNVLSDFVICWTPDGAVCEEERSNETGGTGQVISIASSYNIPVYNLYRPEHEKLFRDFVEREAKE